jgi:hypothetical protein
VKQFTFQASEKGRHPIAFIERPNVPAGALKISLIFLCSLTGQKLLKQNTLKICPKKNWVAVIFLLVIDYWVDYSIAPNSSSSDTVANLVAVSLIA